MKKTRLGEICDLKSGYAFKSSDYVGFSNTLNCRMSNIRPGAIFDINYNIKYLPDEYANKYKEFLLQDDDIIIAMTDLAGDPKILGVPAKVVTNGYNILQNQRVGKLIIKNDEEINFDFLKYALSNPKNKEYFKRFAGGGLQINISNKDILNMQIPLYDKKVQIEIANKLNIIEQVIDIRKTQLEELDELIKSRFIELFGSVEDNVFELETIKVKDACDLINGKAFKPEDWSDEGLPIVRIQNLNNDQAPFNFFNGEIKEQYFIDTGELLFSWSGTPGTSFGAFFWNRGKAVLNQHIFRVKPKIEFNLSFLQFALNGRIDYIISKAHGGVGLQHITKKELDEVELLLPALDRQSEFVAFVEQADKSKLEIQKSLAEMEKLQVSLMDKYFGG